MKYTHEHGAQRARIRRLPLVPALTLAAALLCAGALGASQGLDGLDGARNALEQWVETRKVISKEKRDWVLGKEMLQERIALVQREIDALRGRTSEASASIAEADRKRDELLAQNEKLKSASAALVATATALEARTLALLARLPDPIRERVKPLSQRLPKAGEEAKNSLSERFQNVVGILNEVNKFQREITVTSEVRALGAGASAEVTVLYVGVSYAFYSSADGRLAGVGTSSADGWAWTAANELGPEIAKAIAILRNEQVAEFVQLPLRIQ